MAEQYKGQAFLEKANEAVTKIKEIYLVFGGYKGSCPEEGTLLGDVYACIGEMISLYLAPITGKELHSDDLNDMTVEIMNADKEGINDVMEKYCNNANMWGKTNE